jgi:ferredoxin--NADP+ reductase
VEDLRVAVVGSGPAGIYAAAALTAHEDAAVDVIDRLPTPFGLVRYGVAPALRAAPGRDLRRCLRDRDAVRTRHRAVRSRPG